MVMFQVLSSRNCSTSKTTGVSGFLELRKHEEDVKKKKKKKVTHQFVVLGGEFGEPLVELQNRYYSHQIPEKEQAGRRETVMAATRYFSTSAPPPWLMSSAHFCTKISHVASRLPLALFNIVCLFSIKCWQFTSWSFFFRFNIWFVHSGYIWSMLLWTLTCSQDDWSPAGWVLWCLASSRWCLHPGEAIKADRDVPVNTKASEGLWFLMWWLYQDFLQLNVTLLTSMMYIRA